MLTTEQMRKAKKQYDNQSWKAVNTKGIDWHFTFQDWLDKWLSSGKYELRGCRKGQYVMARFNDVGPYSYGNTKIITCSENAIEASMNEKSIRANVNRKLSNTGKIHPPVTDDTKEKLRQVHLGIKQMVVECPHCNRKGGASLMTRWHFDNCKQKGKV